MACKFTLLMFILCCSFVQFLHRKLQFNYLCIGFTSLQLDEYTSLNGWCDSAPYHAQCDLVIRFQVHVFADALFLTEGREWVQLLLVLRLILVLGVIRCNGTLVAEICNIVLSFL